MRTLLLAVWLAACGDNGGSNAAPTVEPFTLLAQEDLPITRTVAVQNGTLEIPTAPGHGDVTTSGLSLTYMPAPDYHGPDQFDLIVHDGDDDLALTIDVTVASVEDLPFGGEDEMVTNEDTPQTITFEALLDNDSDGDGDALTVASVNSASNGTVTVDATAKTVTFTPTAGFTGDASFVYQLTDGKSETPTLVTVVVGD